MRVCTTLSQAHPAAFLAQLSGWDFNADLCATKHYYETLLSHKVKTALVLESPPVARGSYTDKTSCFCGGNPNDTAAAGSPFLGFCANHTMTCASHTKGFAAMVEPMVEFCMEVFGL